jgi:hypothetical protein
VEDAHRAEEQVHLALGVALAIREAIGEVGVKIGEEEDGGDDAAAAILGRGEGELRRARSTHTRSRAGRTMAQQSHADRERRNTSSRAWRR